MATKPAAFLLPSIISAGLLAIGCAASVDRLPALDRHFYHVLKTPAEQRGFLKMNDSNRRAYLVDRGYMREWERLTPAQREAVMRQEVQVGFTRFGAHLAWGIPADTRDEVTGTKQGIVETYIRCTSGPKIDTYVQDNLECDGTSTEIHVRIVDDRVAAVQHLD